MNRRLPAPREGRAHLAATLAIVVTLVLGVIAVLTAEGEPLPDSGAPRVARKLPRDTLSPSATPAPRADTASDGAVRTATSAAGAAGVAADPVETRTEPHKVFKLAKHPLLSEPVGLKPAGCTLPEWESTHAAIKRFFRAARECLDAAWKPILRRYNLPFHPPDLHFPTGTSFHTECGTIRIGAATAAYYCESDLYIPFTGLQTERYGKSPGIYLALFAHEYGHHVQELSGIMDAVWKRIYQAGRTTPAGLEMARRKELQAQCFSGMFLGTHVGHGGSITDRMFERAWMDQANRGDSGKGLRNHGSNRHYAMWWRRGARTNSLAACNTFTAPSSAVS